MEKNNYNLVSDAFPAFAAELQRLLTEAGEAALAAQVPGLTILDRCRCGDDFCATFYTQPKPEGRYGPGHRNVALTPEQGMLILDVVGDKISCVEVLYRDEVRKGLLASIGSSGTLYFHQDQLSNRMITNSSGGVYSNLGHFPFGEQWYDSTYTKWYFTSYEFDNESGNHYALARSYINRLGRYSSPDEIAGTSTAPQALNRYSYSTGDPINYFDPFGFCPAGTHPATQKELQDILKSAQNLIDENKNPGPSQYTESLSQPTMNDNVFDSQGNLVAMDCTHFINLSINQAGYSVPYATTQQILNQTGPGQYFQPNTTSVSVGNVALISFAGQQPYGHGMFVSSVAPLVCAPQFAGKCI